MAFINWAAHRLMNKTQQLEQVAVEKTEIASAEAYYREPVPMLPGMLDRVTDTDPFTNLEDQLGIARGGEMEHAATVAYHLRKAHILGSSIYKDGMRLAMAANGKNALQEAAASVRHKAQAFPQAVLTTNFATHNWFGEWLLDANAEALLAQELGMPAIELVRDQPFGHAPRYREIFALDGFVFSPERAVVDELVVLQDFGQNANRRARFQELRKRARSVTGKYSGHRVFLVRGRHGQLRLLQNEDRAIEWAAQRGFHIVDPMTMSVDEVLAELRDARCVVGVESSTMTHAALVMQPGGTVVSIVPPDRFCINNCDYLQAMGLGYALMVAHPAPGGGFYADLGELEETVALAQDNFKQSADDPVGEVA